MVTTPSPKLRSAADRLSAHGCSARTSSTCSPSPSSSSSSDWTSASPAKLEGTAPWRVENGVMTLSVVAVDRTKQSAQTHLGVHHLEPVQVDAYVCVLVPARLLDEMYRRVRFFRSLRIAGEYALPALLIDASDGLHLYTRANDPQKVQLDTKRTSCRKKSNARLFDLGSTPSPPFIHPLLKWPRVPPPDAGV